jgi:hypothetical protein
LQRSIYHRQALLYRWWGHPPYKIFLKVPSVNKWLASSDITFKQGWKKPGFFKKNPAQWFFLVFFVFLGFLGFFARTRGFLGFFARTRGFLGFFSVSQILLGASRL